MKSQFPQTWAHSPIKTVMIQLVPSHAQEPIPLNEIVYSKSLNKISYLEADPTADQTSK